MAGILAETDADPQSVVLELTETGQIDTVRGLTVLQERPSGCAGPRRRRDRLQLLDLQQPT